MLVPIRNLGAGGIVSDLAPFDLALNQFVGGNNVVFRDGKAEKARGWTLVKEIDASNDAYWFHTWKDVTGIVYTIFGLDADIKRWDGASVTSPTHPALTSSFTDWQMDQFGKFVLINNEKDTPMYSSATDGSAFLVLPGWTTTFVGTGTVEIIRPFKSFLIALKVEGDMYTVYWCDEASPDAIPTDWDYTSTTNLAGRNPLPASDGQLVDGRALGDAFIVYTDFACYAMRLVANTTFVFSFTRLAARGLLNKECVVQFENHHFCVGNQVIYTHDGSRFNRIADKKVEALFFSEIVSADKVWATKDEVNHEILVYYAVAVSGSATTHATRLMRWNWIDNTWSFEDIDAGDDQVPCLRLGLRTATSTTYAALTTAGRSYADLTETYAELSGAASDLLVPHRLSNDTVSNGAKYWQMESGFTRDGTDYDAHLQKLRIDLDEVAGDTGRVKHISAIYPQMTGTGTVAFRVGGSMGPGEATSWNDLVAFSLDDGSYKVDTRVTGRYLDIQIGEWAGSPTTNNWALSGFDLEVSDGGAR